MHRLLRAATLLVVATSTTAFAQANNPQDPPAIVTHGEAILKRLPDRAFLMISTELREGKAADARRKSAEGMTAIRAALAAAGVPADAIRTTGFTLVPEMERSFTGRPSVRNYVVRNQIEVRIDNLDSLGDVIDAANNPKNIVITIGSPRYDLKNREAAELEASSLAVKSAMARARALATGAGQTLGPVLRIQQGSIGLITPQAPVIRNQMAMSAVDARAGGRGGAGVPESDETPITPGELEVRATVTLTVAIR